MVIVVITTRPSRLFRRMSHVEWREHGSIPLVGSSRKTMLASPIRAIATGGLRFIPPLSATEWACFFSVSPTSAIFFFTCCSMYLEGRKEECEGRNDVKEGRKGVKEGCEGRM